MIQIEDYVNKKNAEQILTDKINKILNKSGVFYRAWARVKSDKSIEAKLEKRVAENYKMQDLFGLRIACYFVEDIKICEKIFNECFKELKESAAVDVLDAETFKPIRCNHVFELLDDIEVICDNRLWERQFDKTFELQIRTIFSEGWHEVEHDLRYKNKSVWGQSPDLSRKFNGINATLETSEWALIKICDDLAYQSYKSRDWVNMLRNKIRIRMEAYELPENIVHIFDESNEIAKRFLNYDKEKLILFLTRTKIPVPLTMENIVYCINELEVKEDMISKYAPEIIRNMFN